MGLFNRGKKPSEQADALSQNGTSLVQHDSHHPGAAGELVSLSDMFLPETQIDTGKAAITLPIGQLATLGPAAASLLPAFRTVTETVSVDTTGLFRVANASVGDVLKAAKDGNFWCHEKNRRHFKNGKICPGRPYERNFHKSNAG